MAAIFARHLDVPVESVSADRGFFDLGGSSITAVAVAGDLRAELDRDIPLEWLFTTTTVDELAHHIEHGENGPDALGTVVELAAGDAGPPLFCIHPISGLSWTYRGLDDHLGGRTFTVCRPPDRVTYPTASPNSPRGISKPSVKFGPMVPITCSDGRSVARSLTKWLCSYGSAATRWGCLHCSTP